LPKSSAFYPIDELRQEDHNGDERGITENDNRGGDEKMPIFFNTLIYLSAFTAKAPLTGAFRSHEVSGSRAGTPRRV
jgi:hypothetical protein